MSFGSTKAGLNRSTANPWFLRESGYAVKTSTRKQVEAEEDETSSAQFSFCLIADTRKCRTAASPLSGIFAVRVNSEGETKSRGNEDPVKAAARDAPHGNKVSNKTLTFVRSSPPRPMA